MLYRSPPIHLLVPFAVALFISIPAGAQEPVIVQPGLKTRSI